VGYRPAGAWEAIDGRRSSYSPPASPPRRRARLRALRGNAEPEGRRPDHKSVSAGARTRTCANEPFAQLLHAMVLEDRSTQPHAFLAAAYESARSTRDPGVCGGATRHHEALGSSNLRSFH